MERTILVTGATDGIGKESARELLSRGHRVLVHGRTKEKAERTAAELGKGAIAVWGDLSRLDEVRSLAALVHDKVDHLDVLVNNAGVFSKKRELTKDGLELTVGVNHFAHFLLTHLLLDLLKKGRSPRIVNTSSGVHQGADLRLDDLQLERDWSGYGSYATSKIMNVLFTTELVKRLKDTGIVVHSLHPGVIATKLLRSGFGGGGSPLSDGWQTTVMVAVDPEVGKSTGKYWSNEREAKPSPSSQDPALAQALYEASAKLTGVTPL
jgi:NAD(P)-dependent dehydrogenase (short-subunit alcohol dehydrogenase family)